MNSFPYSEIMFHNHTSSQTLMKGLLAKEKQTLCLLQATECTELALIMGSILHICQLKNLWLVAGIWPSKEDTHHYACFPCQNACVSVLPPVNNSSILRR